MLSYLKKMFGSANERELKPFQKRVPEINALEPSMQKLSDEELRRKTDEFRARLEKGEKLDQLLPEAFACVREASVRQLQMRHYDVQLIGGMVLHDGRIAEMKTGEGKTLVATLALYLNALPGKGAHLITVNDYLAQRDAEWMGKIYEALGMSVGVIVHGLSDQERKEAYAADITYGTNNEFGFDYLRDNMKVTAESLVQRDLHYAIVDEVDSILIDEARTPLIISGPVNEKTDKYQAINRIIPFLKRDVHFSVDEKAKSVHLTDDGVEEVQKRLQVNNLYDPEHISLVHHIDQALKAYSLFKKDVDYVVRDGQVIIVDEFTGRLMPGRRYSDGLHQALEAKEGVDIANENQTLASITFQNYFRMYDKLAGMTGTAATEADELASIYNLDVVIVPTHKPMIRRDEPDVVYKNERAKYRAIVNDIRERHQKGQPVLVGTVSIEKSERIAEALKRDNVPHVVLNAKHHEKEAQIIANAGQRGSVTIATNMAGRGTDIVLGEGVTELGGLYILGSERHESRRIDNQLRGRAGRQGDPGESRFYLSLEDDLLRIFAGDRMKKVMNFLGMEEDEPIEAKMISNAIEDAQKRVESRNFDIRKHLLKYDDVMNHQRKIIYAWRRKMLFKDDIRDDIESAREDVLEALCEEAIPSKSSVEDWDWPLLNEEIVRLFNSDLDLPSLQKAMEAGESEVGTEEEFFEYLVDRAKNVYAEKEEYLGEEMARRLERMLFLHTLDDRWKDHLLEMDRLREGINLRGYAQKDPALDYQKEGFRLFEMMYLRVKQEFFQKLHRIQLRPSEESQATESQGREQLQAQLDREQKERQERAKRLSAGRGSSGAQGGEAKPQTVRRETQKVGRNDPCHCGSGKKFKKCHGRISASG